MQLSVETSQNKSWVNVWGKSGISCRLSCILELVVASTGFLGKLETFAFSAGCKLRVAAIV